MTSKFNSTSKLSKTLSRAKINNQYQYPQVQLEQLLQVSQLKPMTINLLKQSFLQKSMKITLMLQKVHNFLLGVEQLKWILHQSYKIIQNYIEQIMPFENNSHRIQIQNIEKQYRKLVQRFNQIDGSQVQQITHKFSQKITVKSKQTKNIQQNGVTHYFKFNQTNKIKTARLQADTSNHFIKVELNSKESYSLLDFQAKQSQYKQKINHFEQSLQIKAEELKKEKENSSLLKERLQLENYFIGQKLKNWEEKWIEYRIFTKTLISKLKYDIKFINENKQQQNLNNNIYYNSNRSDSKQSLGFEQVWFQLNRWEQQLLQLDYMVKAQNLSAEKNGKMRQVFNLKMQLETLNKKRQTIKLLQTNNKIQKYNDLQNQQNQNLMMFLLMQATTIENLIQLN